MKPKDSGNPPRPRLPLGSAAHSPTTYPPFYLHRLCGCGGGEVGFTLPQLTGPHTHTHMHTHAPSLRAHFIHSRDSKLAAPGRESTGVALPGTSRRSRTPLPQDPAPLPPRSRPGARPPRRHPRPARLECTVRLFH